MMLSERIPLEQALTATDGWGGDAYTAYERDGVSCVTINYRADTPGDLAQMQVALRAWAAKGPKGAASVESEDQTLLEQLSTRMGEGRPGELRRGMLLVGSFDDEEVEQLGERLRAEVGDEARVTVRADIFRDLPSPGFLLFEKRLPGAVKARVEA